MNTLPTNNNDKILVIGNHEKIIQATLDFDYMKGVEIPSVVAIVGDVKKAHKYWFGDVEVLIPVFTNSKMAKQSDIKADWLLNLSSANSARRTTEDFFEVFPDAKGVHIFCENLAEQDALSLIEKYSNTKYIAGASGVGLLIPGKLKLGAIGGIYGGNLNVLSKYSGNVAIICSSGGMVNELIDYVLQQESCPSFAVSYGGDRFPITSPLQWCLAAEADVATEYIVFFGELGGIDEYEIVKALQKKEITKPMYVYIAGHLDTSNKSIQFGHAKALVKNPDEDAFSKMKALKEAGAIVANTYEDFVLHIKKIPFKREKMETAREWEAKDSFRRNSLFSTATDKGSYLDGFVQHAVSTLLGREKVSPELVAFTDKVFSLLVDHGGETSGAVNTMITARAGKDMSAALAAGILTVGSRFGGAINGAAQTWFEAVHNSVSVDDLLVDHKAKGAYVMGIGHKKYTIHKNDKRVISLLEFAEENLVSKKHVEYAKAVAERTVKKRANLILNVDGAVAAILLDLLVEKEHLTVAELEELITIEFFNSYFLIPRTVGFLANFLSQKKNDEGLFRLPPDEVFNY